MTFPQWRMPHVGLNECLTSANHRDDRFTPNESVRRPPTILFIVILISAEICCAGDTAPIALGKKLCAPVFSPPQSADYQKKAHVAVSGESLPAAAGRKRGGKPKHGIGGAYPRGCVRALRLTAGDRSSYDRACFSAVKMKKGKIPHCGGLIKRGDARRGNRFCEFVQSVVVSGFRSGDSMALLAPVRKGIFEVLASRGEHGRKVDNE